ncbi:MAG: glucose-6-phosphate isomerase [Clostridia bacterium]|nr:glucose-6-phosphate isomerase [Clostridia bacterium]
MNFDCGFDITVMSDPMGFDYGPGTYGPEPEIRRLSDIRSSLADPDCDGPEELYCIAMDVCREDDRADLISRNLLYGVVTYSAGALGDEPVRSQGHIHAVSPSCGASTCEVYEIWEGNAVVYMQSGDGDDAGRCYAVNAGEGDVVIVPPGWVHATVNARTDRPMTFGAWCVRDYGFDYGAVRGHGGIAFFPKIRDGVLKWEANPRYSAGLLTVKNARKYVDFGIESGISIYGQYVKNRSLFGFVTDPLGYPDLWKNYVP